MTGASPKQHDFVPRFYFGRFTDPEGHVWTFDKSTDKVFATSPSKLARESGFYEGPYDATTSSAHIVISLRTSPLRDARESAQLIARLRSSFGSR